MWRDAREIAAGMAPYFLIIAMERQELEWTGTLKITRKLLIIALILQAHALLTFQSSLSMFRYFNSYSTVHSSKSSRDSGGCH